MYNFEQIKNLFINNKKYSLKQLKQIFDIDEETLLSDLNLLEEQGIIILSNDYYQLLDKNNYAVGKLKIYEKYGVFYLDNVKYKIHLDDLGYALDNDLCLFIIDKDSKQAKVKKVIKRFNDLVVCEYTNNKLKVYGSNYFIDVPSCEYKKLVEGTRVLVRIKKNCLDGNIVEIIGHKDDPDIDLKQIALSKSFSLDFSEEYLKELEKIPTEVDNIEGRLDLRDKLIYTIDCDTTKDMDDAISIEQLENGNYLLGVHIADVSHYIKYGSILFKEALKRGTSVYMLDSVIPMIHKYLSNGICSLNPNVDRLTKSCFIEIDQDGNIVDYKIVRSVIKSKKKMKYSEVNEILENNQIIPSYEPFIENLRLAQKLNNILITQNIKRGFIEFLSNDLQIKLDEKNKPVEFIVPKHQTAEKMIENFMLLANQTIATNYSWLPFIYRIHEIPDKDLLEKILLLLKKLGYKIPHIKNFDNSKALQGLLKSLANNNDFKIISNFILRGMKKAKYSNQNIGHFALAYDNYTHFTSPIRRICDLMVHILIDKYEENNFIIDEDINFLEQLLCEISIQATLMEQKAKEAEEEANKMKMAEYMESHINEYFIGKIINITSAGIIVETNNIIGLVSLIDISGDLYIFDKDSFLVIGRKTKNILKIGDLVKIKVIGASKEHRSINFKIEEKIKQKILK